MSGFNLLARVLLGIAALAAFVLLFFFLAAALTLGAIVFAVVLVRFWWLKRRLERAERESTITTEYTVIEREPAGEPRLTDAGGLTTEHGAPPEEQARQPER